jgi:hypothetical protein
MERHLTTAVIAVLMVTAALGGITVIARAQEVPPVAPGPAERVAYAPVLDRAARLCSCHALIPGGEQRCTCDPVDPVSRSLDRYSAITVQNLGTVSTVFLAAYFGPAGATGASDCTTCTLGGGYCSLPVAPGGTWQFPPVLYGSDDHGLTATIAASMVVYSLNMRPARDYGPAWQAWLAEHRLRSDTPVGVLACPPLEAFVWIDPGRVYNAAPWRVRDGATPGADAPRQGALPWPTPLEDCATYEAFHAAFLGGGDATLPGIGLPMAPIRGEPMGAVVTVLGTGDDPAHPVLDRYTASTVGETGLPSTPPTTSAHVYAAPGGYGRTQDGNHSDLVVQNAGASCATVTVSAHRNGHGPLGSMATLSVPPGGATWLDVASTWPGLIEMVTLRVSGDQPLAAAMRNRNFATSAIVTALRERTAPTRWLVPRAYQEHREVASAAGVAVPPGAVAPAASADVSPDRAALVDAVRSAGVARALAPLAAEGWETNIAMFNPGTEQQEVLMRMQAGGQPPRGPVGYPIEPLSQLVLQPGFGLGLPGGPGWMEITTVDPPIATAVESLRTAANEGGLVIETWAAPAWPDEAGVPAPRTIGLPDLGGPAVGGIAPSELLTHTATMTDALTARIAIQNPLTRTARVAIDSYALGGALGCGYVGTVERSIDPRQTVIVPVGDLPATAFGGNSALLRVLSGQAAATVEIVRNEWSSASLDDVPLDLSSAYNGVPVAGAMAAPTVVTGTLTVTPTEIAVELGDVMTPFERTVSVDAVGTARCLSFTATSDMPWLTVSPARKVVPGTLTLHIDPRQVTGGGRTHTATVTVAVAEPGVAGNPGRVRVTLTFTPAGAVYLPYAAP